jgi:hypothetical protein
MLQQQRQPVLRGILIGSAENNVVHRSAHDPNGAAAITQSRVCKSASISYSTGFVTLPVNPRPLPLRGLFVYEKVRPSCSSTPLEDAAAGSNPSYNETLRFTLSIEGKSPPDLIHLAQAGARIEVDGRRYSVPDLVAIARALRPEGILSIVNAEGKAINDLLSIVSAAPGKVHLS